MEIRKLVTTLGFDVDTKSWDKYHKMITGIKGGLAHLGEAIVGEGAALFALAEFTAHSAVEFKNLAQQTGTSTTKIQELTFAAKQWHVEGESMTTGLRMLSRHALLAMQGNTEASRMLAQGGVRSLYDAKGHLLQTDQVLMQIADHFKTMPDGIEKTGLATMLLGRGGAQLIPILNKGSEAIRAMGQHGKDLGVVMGEDAVEKAEKMQHALLEVRAMILGVRNSLGVELMPVITEVIQKMSAWYNANKQVLIPKLIEFVKNLANSLPGLADTMLSIANTAMKVVDAMGGLGTVLKWIISLWIAMGVAEAFASGGLSVMAQLAGAAAAGAIAGGIMTFGGTGGGNAAANFGQGSAMQYAAGMSGGKGGGVQHNYNSYSLALPPGTPQLHAQEVLKIVKQHDEMNMRALVAAATPPRATGTQEGL